MMVLTLIVGLFGQKKGQLPQRLFQRPALVACLLPVEEKGLERKGVLGGREENESIDAALTDLPKVPVEFE